MIHFNIKTMAKPLIKMYFDGACRGNGAINSISGCGYYTEIYGICGGGYLYIGLGATSNISEYQGLIQGLRAIKEYNYEKINVYGDSKLIIDQINGNMCVRSPTLIPLYLEAKEIIKAFDCIDFTHIPRKENKKADQFANLSIDINKKTYY